MNNNEKKQQATYAELTADTKELIAKLSDAVTSHDQEAQGRNEWGHWGNNGDLEHLNNELALMLGFITGDDELADNGYNYFKNRK
jgi:hypothetical protein